MPSFVDLLLKGFLIALVLILIGVVYVAIESKITHRNLKKKDLYVDNSSAARWVGTDPTRRTK